MESELIFNFACKKLQKLIDATKKYSARVRVETLCKRKPYGCLCIIVVRKKSFTGVQMPKILHQFIKLRSLHNFKILYRCLSCAKASAKITYKNYWKSA